MWPLRDILSRGRYTLPAEMVRGDMVWLGLIGLLLLLIGGATSPVLPLDRPRPSPVRAELVTNASHAKPGAEVLAGVLFQLQPGWHIYWQNPGDGGLPTVVRLRLPEGFQVGALQWPIPDRFSQPGNLTGFGYTDSVLLAARVRTPSDIRSGQVIPIRADVSWLACENVCIPGHARLETTFTVASTTRLSHQKLFSRWERSLPIPAASQDSPFSAEIRGSLPPAPGETEFTIVIRWKQSAVMVDWFPMSDEALNIDDVAISTDSGTTRISFHAGLYAGHDVKSSRLESLVVYTDAAGRRNGIQLPVTLRQPTASQTKTQE